MWSYGSLIYNYLCNQCLSPLMLWVRISIRASCTTVCDKVCQWLVTGWWFSPGPTVSSTNKTGHHDITEILLKVALYTIKQANIMQRFHVQFIQKILSLMDKIHITVHVHVNIDFFLCCLFKKKNFVLWFIESYGPWMAWLSEKCIFLCIFPPKYFLLRIKNWNIFICHLLHCD